MAANVTITIRGLRDVQEKLAQFPDRVESDVVMQALQEGSDLGLRKIQEMAPVKTGKVRRGFKAAPSKVHKRAPMYGYYIYLAGGKLGRSNPNHNFYARWVEYGYLAGARGKNAQVVSRPRSDRPGQTRKRRVGHKQIPGQYFVHRAFRATAESSARQIAWASERGINKLIDEMERD